MALPLSAQTLDRTVTQWSPFLEWSLENPSFDGNPFDLIATVAFVHPASGETHETGMFYAGGSTWRFRFTGTRTGQWNFATASADPELNGRSGTVTVTPNPNPDVLGFVTNRGSRWVRQVDGEGSVRAFVPQFVMIGGPQVYHQNPAAVASEINRFIFQHGFTGFHILVACRWFDLNDRRCRMEKRDPDFRTFEALELLISQTHAAGGNVHIWAWGDEQRKWTPTLWGLNGTEDQRIQRYIAARLGALPGWTMGYGFDLQEWVVEDDLRSWHDFMTQHLGWSHPLGARATTSTLDQIYEGLDYSGYEQFQPDYEKYVETIERRPNKPSFSEDRFRVRDDPFDKDYDFELTRRGLWKSTMAGGVANIWGNLLGSVGANAGLETSSSYPRIEWVQTNFLFFRDRFATDMIRCNDITDGVCLRYPDNQHYMFFTQASTSIQMDLAGMSGSQPAVAVDTRLPYREISLGQLAPGQHTWEAPYQSDWAIAVGTFPSTLPAGKARIVGAASFFPRAAPEAIMTGFGSGLASGTQSANALPLPGDLAGASVMVRDSNGVQRQAPLFFASPNQVNFFLPQGTAVGQASVVLLNGGQQVATGVIDVQRVAPSVFAANGNGLGAAAALVVYVDSDGTQETEFTFQCGAPGECTEVPIDVSSSNRDAVLILFGTGIRGFSSNVTVTVDGENVPVVAGPQSEFVGLDQANAGPLPRNLEGRERVRVVLKVDGRQANTVNIAIE